MFSELVQRRLIENVSAGLGSVEDQQTDVVLDFSLDKWGRDGRSHGEFSLACFGQIPSRSSSSAAVGSNGVMERWSNANLRLLFTTPILHDSTAPAPRRFPRCAQQD